MAVYNQSPSSDDALESALVGEDPAGSGGGEDGLDDGRGPSLPLACWISSAASGRASSVVFLGQGAVFIEFPLQEAS